MILAPLLLVPSLILLAHDWYPLDCCAGRDCHPIADTDVTATAAGWFVKATGETIPYSSTQTSPDGRVHRCWNHFARNPAPHTICLFVPPPGS